MATDSQDDYTQIEDTDNLNQKLQIRAINDARDRVRQVRNTAHEQIASATDEGRATAASGGSRVYLQVVKSYALELAPLLVESPQLWQSQTLLTGEWGWQGHSQTTKEVVEVDPETVAVQITGVDELLQTDFPIVARFGVTLRDKVQDETQTRTESWHPGFASIDQIVIELDKARKGAGLWLDPPDEIGSGEVFDHNGGVNDDYE